MGLVILLLLVLIFGGLMVAAIGWSVGLLLTLVMAGIIGWLADLVVPGKLPGGTLGAVLAGLIGGFIGGALFHWLNLSAGPRIFDVQIIPAFVGAVIVAGAAEMFTRRERVR
jgi:uncharacterized membrane protein YeaQ/YmgE (transglycosylase-associated protein family)